MVRYTIIIETAKGNFSAYCPDLPGCIATGRTKEETIKNIRESIIFHLEGLKREKLAIPEPSTQATYVEVSL